MKRAQRGKRAFVSNFLNLCKNGKLYNGYGVQPRLGTMRNNWLGGFVTDQKRIRRQSTLSRYVFQLNQ